MLLYFNDAQLPKKELLAVTQRHLRLNALHTINLQALEYTLEPRRSLWGGAPKGRLLWPNPREESSAKNNFFDIFFISPCEAQFP